MIPVAVYAEFVPTLQGEEIFGPVGFIATFTEVSVGHWVSVSVKFCGQIVSVVEVVVDEKFVFIIDFVLFSYAVIQEIVLVLPDEFL